MITQDQVRKLFNYNPETGELIRRVQTASRAKVGDVVGCANTKGYLMVRVNGKLRLNHKVAFLHFHGYLPKYIDHINGVKNDNRIKNLRSCTLSQNNRNATKRKDNTSGFKNVSWNKRVNKYRVQIKVNRKNKYIGHFTDINEANQAAIAARLKYHGEFANHGDQS